MRKFWKWLCLMILTIFLVGCGVELGPESRTEIKEPDTEIVTKELCTETTATEQAKDLDTLDVHFIDAGQGDSTLIVCGNRAMLVDAGDNAQGTKVQNYLKKQGIERLDYVILTHPDADHIGGMDVILTKFDCGMVLMPDVESDTATYRDVVDAMKYRNYQPMNPSVGDVYELGDAEFTIVSPCREYNDTNGNSIAFVLRHGSKAFFFSGDASMEAEQDMIDSGIPLDADVYHVGHHGSYTSSSEELLEAVKPSYAVISCAENNSYGFPHEGTLLKLRKAGIEVFRTDEQGSMIAVSDGVNISWNCGPSTTWKAGERIGSGEEISQASEGLKAEPDGNTTYICNENTGKFHKTDCASVLQISPKNRKDVTCPREELIDEGYSPCGNCKP